MSRCDSCGNDYARSFQVIAADGQRFTFDSLECAAYKLAPACSHCGCRILGHGVEVSALLYCSAHCAHASGDTETVDNAAHA